MIQKKSVQWPGSLTHNTNFSHSLVVEVHFYFRPRLRFKVWIKWNFNFCNFHFYRKRLRVVVRKNLISWNLGGQQIISRPIFSDSPYKNRLWANFLALEDQFWQKFWTLSTAGRKKGLKWPKFFFFLHKPENSTDHHENFFGDQIHC